MGIAKEDRTLEAEEQIIDPYVPSWAEGEHWWPYHWTRFVPLSKPQEWADPLD